MCPPWVGLGTAVLWQLTDDYSQHQVVASLDLDRGFDFGCHPVHWYWSQHDSGDDPN